LAHGMYSELEVDEMRYIDHMGAYTVGARVRTVGVFGHKVAARSQQPTPPNVEKLLENYVRWGPMRVWPDGMDGDMLTKYAERRLSRLRWERLHGQN